MSILIEWDTFPPAFDGLLPEGVLLDQLLAKHKLDRSDKWGQLIAVGQDLSGFVSVLPEGEGLPGWQIYARRISPQTGRDCPA